MWSFENFTNMEDIKRKYNLTINLSKFTSNKKNIKWSFIAQLCLLWCVYIYIYISRVIIKLSHLSVLVFKINIKKKTSLLSSKIINNRTFIVFEKKWMNENKILILLKSNYIQVIV